MDVDVYESGRRVDRDTKRDVVVVTCAFCGKQNTRAPSEVKRRHRLFCHRACYDAWIDEQRMHEEEYYFEREQTQW